MITEHQSGGKTVWVDLFNPSDREIGEAKAALRLNAELRARSEQLAQANLELTASMERLAQAQKLQAMASADKALKAVPQPPTRGRYFADWIVSQLDSYVGGADRDAHARSDGQPDPNALRHADPHPHAGPLALRLDAWHRPGLNRGHVQQGIRPQRRPRHARPGQAPGQADPAA